MKTLTDLPSLDGALVTPHALLTRYEGLARQWHAAQVGGVAAAAGVAPAAPAPPLAVAGRQGWVRLWESVRLYRAQLPRLRSELKAAEEAVRRAEDTYRGTELEQEALTKADAAYLSTAASRATELDTALKDLSARIAVVVRNEFAGSQERWTAFLTTRGENNAKRLAEVGGRLPAARAAVRTAQDALARHATAFGVGRVTVRVDAHSWILLDGSGPDAVKYAALGTALHAEAVRRAGGPDDDARLAAALREQVDRIRQLADGTVAGGLTEAETALGCVWFGAEVVRNPRSFGTGLMMLELLSERVPYGRAGKKGYDWRNVLAGVPHDKESDAEWAERMGRHGWAAPAPAAPGSLDLWGGKHPMAHKHSDAEGAAPIGAQLNVVQVKEVSLLAHWVAHRSISTGAGFDAEVRALLG